MALELRKTVVDILKSNQGKYFTARELAEKVMELKPQECEEKWKNSRQKVANKQEFLSVLVAEISRQRPDILKDPDIKTTAERPRKYYYSNKTDVQEIEEVEQGSDKQNKSSEKDLYPLLFQYLFEELGIYPKRIDEKKSSNTKGKNGNKWLHPDVVGLQVLSEDWTQEVKDCADKHSFDKTSLWSFEVKIKINQSNVREVFFQTVSNSTWANNSYLVAKEIDDEAMQELRILCGGHDIGVILLNEENPTESQILIPATEKEYIDWNMINRVVKENSDFKNFIKLITEFYQTNRIKPNEWDVKKYEE